MLCSIRMQPLWGSESSSQSCRNRKHKILVGQPCFHDFGSQIHVFLLGKQNSMEVSDLIDILCYFWTGTSALPSESHSTALWVLLLLEFVDYEMTSWSQGHGPTSILYTICKFLGLILCCMESMSIRKSGWGQETGKWFYLTEKAFHRALASGVAQGSLCKQKKRSQIQNKYLSQWREPM